MLALALLAFWAGLSPPLFSPVHGAQATPEQEAADQRVMGKIRTEIEAIPEAMREFEGIEILEKSLPNFALPATQQRVLLSIGELSAKLGGSDKAIDAFQRGLALAADPFLTMTCRNRLAEELSKAGRGNEAIAVLATVPEPDAEAASPSDLPPNQTDDVYEAERKRIELLIDQGKDEEGFARILRFANFWAHHRPIVYLRRLRRGNQLAAQVYRGTALCRRRSELPLQRNCRIKRRGRDRRSLRCEEEASLRR
jgi:tetratricopeptide (TPR) repeat protein